MGFYLKKRYNHNNTFPRVQQLFFNIAYKIHYLCSNSGFCLFKKNPMNNNDVLKKLRVALQLRDDQIVEILNLVDFRISKGELGNFFRDEKHPKYMDCGDQILRNFLNGLVLYLRGTKEEPKNPTEVLAEIKQNKTKTPQVKPEVKKEIKKNPTSGFKPINSKIKFKNGKNKKS